MILAWFKRFLLSTLIWSTSFSVAFASPINSYLNLDVTKFNYGDVSTVGTTVYVDSPASEIFDYAVAQALAYSATLNQWQLQSTVIKIFDGQGCAAVACITITRQEDGYKSVETIEYSSNLNLGSTSADYGKPGKSSGRGGGGPKGPSPGAKAAYESALADLNNANSELSSANSSLNEAVGAMNSANTELNAANSAVQSAESSLNSAISQYNAAASAAEAQAAATHHAQQMASNSATHKARLQSDLKRRQGELESKKQALANSKAKLANSKAVAEGEVAKVGDKAVKPTDKTKGDTTKATGEAAQMHNNAAEAVTRTLDLEKSAGTIDTAKLLASIDSSQIPLHNGNLRNPFNNNAWCVYSGVGPRPTEDNPDRMHEGLDLSLPEGSPIYSPVAGVVSSVRYEKYSFGQSVEILTTHDGKTRYLILGHMVKGSPTVKVGQVINPGELVGKVGTTGGDGKVRPHLHLELRECDSLKRCSVKKDIHRQIVNPEAILTGSKRCPGR